MLDESTNIWSSCLDYIKECVEPNAFRALFEALTFDKFESNVLTLHSPSDYICEQIDVKYRDIFAQALKKVLNYVPRVEYNVTVDGDAGLDRPGTTALGGTPPAVSVKTRGDIKNPFEKVQNSIQIDSNLNPDYVMDTFVMGDCNRLAYQAGKTIISNPGKIFNPMFVWGASGLGKTHLVNAIGLEIKKKYPEKSVLYLSANLFMRQFVEAKLHDEVNDFIHFYQLIDVLILDDVQDFADKKGTQNTFFHIFNHLHQSGKQIIMTCDKDPNELDGIEERLVSRFKWSLVAKMEIPDVETRKVIIRKKANGYGMNLNDDIVDLIASRIDNNVRELEGALTKLLAYSICIKSELTLAMVEDSIGTAQRNDRVQNVTVESIRRKVCEYFNIDENAIQQKTRVHDVVEARQVAMYFAKTMTQTPLSKIGSVMGKKNHATVLYSCKAVEEQMSTNREFKSRMEDVRRHICK